MKTFLKTIAILSVVICFGACSNNGDGFDTDGLEVTPYNISGYWKLTNFNGMDMPEGAYFYIEYKTKGKKFVMYENFKSMYPCTVTGTYSITKDRKKGSILSGEYDFGKGEWNNDYIVVELLEDFMLLKSDTENGEYCSYERCGGIPAEILEQVVK